MLCSCIYLFFSGYICCLEIYIAITIGIYNCRGRWSNLETLLREIRNFLMYESDTKVDDNMIMTTAIQSNQKSIKLKWFQTLQISIFGLRFNQMPRLVIQFGHDFGILNLILIKNWKTNYNPIFGMLQWSRMEKSFHPKYLSIQNELKKFVSW